MAKVYLMKRTNPWGGFAISLLAVATLGVITVLSTPVRAATECAPVATGVPGNGGPPMWSGGTAWTTIDDPRWNGGARESFPNFGAATADATARVISQGNVLSVSLQVLVDPDKCTFDDFNNSWDRIFIGFRNPTTQAVQLAEVGLTGTDQATATGHYEKSWTRPNGTTALGGGVGLPAWASDVHLFVNQTAGATTIPWAVNLKIDLAQARTDLGTASLAATDFWYALSIGTGHASSPAPSADIIAYEWPSGAGSDLSLISGTGTQLAPGLPATWGKVELGVSGAACKGIKIDPMQIQTDQTPSSKIATNADNTFTAKPDWNGEGIVANKIQARFRLAGWGSQVGALPASCTDPSTCLWRDIPGGASVKNAGTLGQISFTCHQGGTPACPTLPSGNVNDQCMLVELSAAGATTVPFLQGSAYRNMDFGTASTYERLATISIKDAKPIPGGGPRRDVFIYVKTMNMPSGPARRQDVVVAPNNQDRKIDVSANVASSKGSTAPERTSYEQYTDHFATYEVHVYHDTSPSTARVHRLEAQVPFGYFVEHAGDVEGWRHQLEGVGVTLQEILPNYYKVVIPEGGSIKVKTTIRALEPGGTVPHHHCSCEIPGRTPGSVPSNAAALAGVVGLFFARRGRVAGRNRRFRPSSGV
jgi:hypothetical protein